MERRRRRRYLRFQVNFKVEVKSQDREGVFGEMKDFSREGLLVSFDKFDFACYSPLELVIQRPNSNFSISLAAVPLWKKAVEGKFHVGFRINELAPVDKAEILEYGYHKWVSAHLHYGGYSSVG